MERKTTCPKKIVTMCSSYGIQQEHGEWATAFAQFAWELVANYEQEDEEFVEASTTRRKQLQAFHGGC